MQNLKIKDIVPDENQPRKYFDAVKLHSLKESIKKHGIMSPLIVQDMGAGKFLLVDGERRFRAAVDLGFKEVPAMVEKPSSASERLVRQFNVQEQHEEWTPIEKAQAIIHLSEELGLSLRDTCRVLGVSLSDTTKYVAFAELTDKASYVKSEVPLDYVVSLKGIKTEVRSLYEKVFKKEFLSSDAKKLEARFITSIKNGEISTRSDGTRLKDAFQKNPKLIEKYMNNANATPRGLFLESKAEGANALRNVTYNCRYIIGYISKFLEQRDVAISPEQLQVFKSALNSLQSLIDLAE